MGEVQFYHRSFTPDNHLWNGELSFEAEVFVDDGMFLETVVGRRWAQTVQVWGRGADYFSETVQ